MSGEVLWEQRYNGPANDYDLAKALALDRSGNVVVTGSSGNSDGRFDFYTAKYAAADGALLWEIRYDSPGHGDDRVARRGLALGPNDMIAVTGSSSGDYATVLYRETLLPLCIERLAMGVGLRFTGSPDRIYTIERAFSVTGPWIAIGTRTAPVVGLLEFEETSLSNTAAYYRISTTQ